MATYTITLNERTSSGKALIEYLQALGLLVKKVSPKAKSSYQRSQEDKQAGRIEKFSSSEEMFKSLGIKPVSTAPLADIPMDEEFADMDKELYTPEEAYELTMKDIKAIYDDATV